MLHLQESCLIDQGMLCSCMYAGTLQLNCRHPQVSYSHLAVMFLVVDLLPRLQLLLPDASLHPPEYFLIDPDEATVATVIHLTVPEM